MDGLYEKAELPVLGIQDNPSMFSQNVNLQPGEIMTWNSYILVWKKNKHTSIILKILSASEPKVGASTCTT